MCGPEHPDCGCGGHVQLAAVTPSAASRAGAVAVVSGITAGGVSFVATDRPSDALAAGLIVGFVTFLATLGALSSAGG